MVGPERPGDAGARHASGLVGRGRCGGPAVPVVAIGLGLLVYASMRLVLNRTRVGLIVRAGVENGEMVQVMGHNLSRYFTGVRAAGSGLAGLGGLMWAMFSQSVRPAMGGEQLVFAFIVVIIGGLGSVTGSLVGALLVGLSYNYVAFLSPRRRSASTWP